MNFFQIVPGYLEWLVTLSVLLDPDRRNSLEEEDIRHRIPNNKSDKCWWKDPYFHLVFDLIIFS